MKVIRVAADVTQEEHVPGLPIGTRGGVVVPFTFAQDGEYDIQMRLARNRSGFVGGLREPGTHVLELLLDRERIETFTVDKPPEGDDHSLVDAHLTIRTQVTGGPHDLGVTFQKRSSSLPETERQPLQSHFNETRHPRLTPAVYEILHFRAVLGARGRRHSESPADLCLSAECGGGRRGVRKRDSVYARAARLSETDLRVGCGRADGLLPGGPGRREILMPVSGRP